MDANKETEVKEPEKPESEGEDKPEGKELIAYKLVKHLGEGMEEGCCLYLTREHGEALVAAELAELASEEDIYPEMGEDCDMETPVITASIERILHLIEEKASTAMNKVLTEVQAENIIETPVLIPAQVKAGPIYKSPGDYIKGIIKAQFQGDTVEANKVMAYQEEAAKDWALKGVQCKAAPLGINESTQSQGGYLVNPQFSPDVYAIPHGQIDLQAMCVPIEAKSNIYNQRFINESSLANGSIFGGLNMVATTEGNSFSSSLPAWSNLSFQLQKLAIFVYYTMEIMEDAAYPFEAELNEYCRKAFIYGINTQIVQGNTLEGFLNTPALVTITSSANDTDYHITPSTSLTYADLATMWAAVYPDSQVSEGGMWLFHPSLTNPLVQMTYTFAGSAPAWGIQYDAQMGLEGRGSGFPGTPYRIFGKRAYPCWAMSAPGNAGDIMYIDFNTVLHYRRPYRVEVSKEYQFGTDQVAIRFVNRLDVKTRFRNKITGPTGTQQFSAIVCRSGSLT